jgi:hypothetical protein
MADFHGEQLITFLFPFLCQFGDLPLHGHPLLRLPVNLVLGLLLPIKGRCRPFGIRRPLLHSVMAEQAQECVDDGKFPAAGVRFMQQQFVETTQSERVDFVVDFEWLEECLKKGKWT